MTKIRAAYTPALHSAATKFIKQSEAGIYCILSPDLFEPLPRLDRDIRALHPEAVRAMLRALYPEFKIEVITTDNVKEKLDDVSEVTMPDEDISHIFADNFLPEGVVVNYISTFLRWDKFASTSSRIPDTATTITHDELDVFMMNTARAEATKSPDWWRQVGALILTEDGDILTGHNRPYPIEHGTLEIFGDPRSNFDAGEHIESSRALHAEAGLIASAAREGIKLDGAKLYVTTFPCPPCAKLVAASGIKTVYFQDGYSLTDASEVLAASDISVVRVAEN